jgi:hypothetical protein
MADVVTFWLDNKKVAGTKAARHGDQVLVSYRDRFYSVMNDAALMKGGKPLRYSQTSLPTVWKIALRGDLPAVELPNAAELNAPVIPAVARKAKVKKEKEVSVMPEPASVAPAQLEPHTKPDQAHLPKTKATKKTEGKQAAQSMVTADCPYCNQKHEIPVEKGRSGKPFFHICTKCKSNFAVRFVQVTIYQAQVAGFR